MAQPQRQMRNPLMAVFGALLVVAVITVSVVQAFTDDQVQITVRSSPPTVDLIIDGEEHGVVESGETVTVATSDQSVEVLASQQGYETYQGTYELDGQDELSIDFVLPPTTEEAAEEAETLDELSHEQRMTEEYLSEAEDAHSDHPILHDLPEVAQQFRAYQGLSDSEEEEFAIHLYLYESEEDEGRAAFEAWAEDAGYDIEPYEIVEHIEPRDEDSPDPVVEDPPTVEDLEAADRTSVEDREISAEDLDAAELAQHFALVTSTWEPAEDQIPTESLHRAAPLMTDEQAEGIITPQNPMLSELWRTAAESEAISHPWVTYAESEGDGQYTVDVCWAWLGYQQEASEEEGDDSEGIAFDGPRTYEITTAPDGDDYVIEHYRYEDPDPFVEPTGDCEPES